MGLDAETVAGASMAGGVMRLTPAWLKLCGLLTNPKV